MLTAGIAFSAAAALSPMGTRAAGANGDALLFHTSPAAAVVCWVGNVCTGATGTYTFNTAGGACTGYDDGKTGGCSVSSKGAFTSIVCGTGTVLPGSSSASITEADGTVVAVSGLKITFVGGLGIIQATATEGGVSKAADGVVQISPSKLTAPNHSAAGDGVCTPGFTVESASATTA
jgi:hypothetical protein